MFEMFNEKDTGTFAYNGTVPVSVERRGGLGRCFVEADRKGTRCGESAETDEIDVGFSAATDRNIRFSKLIRRLRRRLPARSPRMRSQEP
jgi:hypothetical protein